MHRRDISRRRCRARCADPHLQPGKNVTGMFARDVRHHVQAAAVAHREDSYERALLRGGAQNFVEQRNERVIALESKSFRAEVTRLHHVLENFGAHQPFKNLRAIRLWRWSFEMVNHPLAALGVGNVHEFRADRTAINRARFIS